MQQGELIEWNDDRGFGFILPDDGGGRLFVHVSEFGRIARRPQIGDRLSFVVGPGRDGKAAAITVSVAGANAAKGKAPSRQVSAPARRLPIRVSISLLLLAMPAFGWLAGSIPLALLGLYFVLGLASFGLYYNDKQSAAAGTWRISENTLHGLDLAFGIIGGLLAQEMFRHKTAKPAFAAMTYGIAALHALGLAGVISGVISLAPVAALIPG